VQPPPGRRPAPLAPTLVERLGSSPLDVRHALVALCDAARRLGVPPEAGARLELVLAEALNNVAEHAYRGRADGWILVELDLAEGWIAGRIRDAGRPMPGGALPVGRAHALDVPTEALPEGGFGWQMIHALTAQLAYAREAGQNRLTFLLPSGAED
jgi:serine/threonine-protein kinase RsbW